MAREDVAGALLELLKRRGIDYLFSNPPACHRAAASLKPPVATVVFNTGRSDATRRYTTRLYPLGIAVRQRDLALADLEPRPDYGGLCRFDGGYAERVAGPAHFAQALARMLKAFESEHRRGLLDVVCD